MRTHGRLPVAVSVQSVRFDIPKAEAASIASSNGNGYPWLGMIASSAEKMTYYLWSERSP